MKFDPSMKTSSWSPQILVAKRNCTELHYYEDDYIKYFCPKTSQDFFLTIGVTCRVTGIRKVIEKFFSQFPNQKVQFVNLGAGLDTVSFWVMNKFPNSVCYDSDLEYQVKLKVDILLNTKELLQMFPSHQATESTFSSPRYKLFPCDLTKVDELNKLKNFGFSDQLPTVYLSECVLAYVQSDKANSVIKFLYDYSKAPSVFIFQDFFLPYTPFMTWFMNNILKNNAKYVSAYDYPNKQSLVSRYKSLGWEDVFVHDLTFVYNQMLDKTERLRLRNIENFNDLKNLSIYCAHFLIGVATKDFDHSHPFLNYLNHKEYREFDKDDELLPTFTEEQLHKETDIDVLIGSLNNWINVTLCTDTEECKSYYSKFK